MNEEIGRLVMLTLEAGSLAIYVIHGSIEVEIDTFSGTYHGEGEGADGEAVRDALDEALSDIGR